MAIDKRRNKISFRFRRSKQAISIQEQQSADRVLAALAALAYALDHPECFECLNTEEVEPFHRTEESSQVATAVDESLQERSLKNGKNSKAIASA